MTLKEWMDDSYYANYPKKDIYSIGCDDCDIDSLDGIEEYPNLESFQCCDNPLRDLDGIEDMKNIKMLTIYNNQLESLKGIEHLPKLTRLYCAGNPITPREHMRIPFLRMVELDWDCNIDKLWNMNLNEIQQFLQEDVNVAIKKLHENYITRFDQFKINLRK